MKNKLIYVIALVMMMASCGEPNDLESKKEKLDEYKSEIRELNAKIAELQNEIASVDTTYGKQATRNAVLVNTKIAEVKEFKHKIEVRGEVESRRNVMLSAETAGRIESIKVSEGQQVRSGQTLLTIDADILRNNISELKTSLELADAVYQRQSNLWEKNIGTEIQYLEAKNKKESLERKLATAYSQLEQAVVKAPFSGVIDELPAKEGEMAQPGAPLVRLVNPDAMYIEADVSERYMGDIQHGDEVELYFPTRDQQITSKVSAVGEVINSANRTFSIDVQLPKLEFRVKPNQVVILKMTDYRVNDAILVPTEVILADKEGKFLYTAAKENGKTVARKTRVKVGKSQSGTTEILEGVNATDLIVTAGYRNLTDGVMIKSVERSTETAQL